SIATPSGRRSRRQRRGRQRRGWQRRRRLLRRRLLRRRLLLCWRQGRRRTLRRRGARRRPILGAIIAGRLHATHKSFELLVAILQLFDGAGELANLRFEAVDAHHQIGGRGLRESIGTGRRIAIWGGTTLLSGRNALAAPEQVLEKAKASFALLRRNGAGAGKQHGGDHGCPDRAKPKTGHLAHCWLRA